MNIEISIITINYNGLADTCALIESIPADDPSIEVIVVDNASRNDEATVISQRFPHVKVVRCDRNLGYAGGNNMGIINSRGRYLFFVNNDTLFNLEGKMLDVKAFFGPLVRRMEQSPEVAVVCPKIRFAQAPQLIQYAGYTPLSEITLRNSAIGYGEPDNGQYDEPHPTPYAHGAAMLISNKAIGFLGAMPECYFLYYEELDWSLFFTKRGYSIWYEPASTIYHKESRSTGANSALKTYYITRNRLIFASRHVKWPRRLLTYFYLGVLVAARDAIRHLRHGRTEHVKAIYRALVDFRVNRWGYSYLASLYKS